MNKLKKIYKLKYHKHLLKGAYETVLQELAEVWNELQFDLEFPTDLVGLSAIHNSVPTRWNSIPRMARSILNNYPVIAEVLQQLASQSSSNRNSLDLELTPYELRLIAALIAQLEPFERFTLELCGDSQVTGSKFLRAFLTLERFFDSSTDVNYRQLPEIILFRAKVRGNLQARIPVTDDDVVQAILDPNCKVSEIFERFISNERSCAELISDKLAEANGESIANEQPNQSINPVSFSMAQLENEFSVRSPTRSSQSAEVFSYLNSDRERVYIDPSDFWRKRPSHPLYKLYQMYGARVQVTVVSERTFSKTSLIDTQQRSALLDSNLESIIFINENYQICKQLIDQIILENQPVQSV